MRHAKELDFLKAQGRDILRRHFLQPANCIAAARMVLEFCNAIGVACRVVNVIAVVRNQAAKELNIWPFTKGPHDDAEAERRRLRRRRVFSNASGEGRS